MNPVHLQRGEALTGWQRRWRVLLVSGPGLAWLGLFCLAPLALLTGVSFLSRDDLGQIGLPVTWDNYKRLLGFGLLGFDPIYPVVLCRSLALGLATAALCVLAGLPLAFFIAGLSPRRKPLALTLVVIPFWTNLLIRSYAWQVLLGPGSWLADAAVWLGLIPPGGALYPSTFAVALCMVCDYLPFLVLPLYASVEKLDWTLVEAAMDLGANRWNVLRHGLLPQVSPGLAAGFVLVFLPATGQFVIPDLLGGAKTTLLGNAVQQQFGTSLDWPFGSAIAVAALGAVVLGLWVRARQAALAEPGLI